MNKTTRSSIISIFCLIAITSHSANTNMALARRAYSYADMYAPQESQPEVVKPKKKPRKTKSKPISVSAQKSVEQKSQTSPSVEELADTADDQKSSITNSSQEVEQDKPKKSEKSERINTQMPVQNVSKPILLKANSPETEKAKRITLEELLGVDIVKGMSSK